MNVCCVQGPVCAPSSQPVGKAVCYLYIISKSVLQMWRPKLERLNITFSESQKSQRVKLRVEHRKSKRSLKQISCLRNSGYRDIDGRLWQVVLKMLTTTGAPKHINGNFNSSPPRPLSTPLLRYPSAGDLSHCVTFGQSFQGGTETCQGPSLLAKAK